MANSVSNMKITSYTLFDILLIQNPLRKSGKFMYGTNLKKNKQTNNMQIL